MGLLKKIKEAKLFYTTMKEEATKNGNMGISEYIGQIKSNPDLYGTIETDKINLLDKAAEKAKDYKPKGSCKDGVCGYSKEDPLRGVFSQVNLIGFALRYKKSTGKLEKILEKGFTDLEKELIYLDVKNIQT